MKKIRVLSDVWLENRLTVEERALLMALFKEMDKMNKVFVPSYRYLNEISGVTLIKPLLRKMQEKKILKIVEEEKNQFVEIKLRRGKSVRVPENIFYIQGKWERTLILTFHLIKDHKEYLWTEKGELTNLFRCSGSTITKHLRSLVDNGYILKKRYKDKYKITLLV